MKLTSTLALLLALIAPANAAVITVVNKDPPGKGLNDQTPRAPEGRNPGLTVGEQRRIAYQYAADLWGAALQSKVEIIVGASFDDLTCTPTQAVLGAAGTAWVAWNDPADGKPSMVYHGAIYNAMQEERVSISEDGVDIVSYFNANLGGSNPDGTPCFTGGGWYYGLDGNTPPSRSSFLDTVMHEIGHGLGSSGFTDARTGILAGRLGMPELIGFSDPFSENIFDNLQGKAFSDPSMTDAMRSKSSSSPGAPAWRGGMVNAQAPMWLDEAMKLTIQTPTTPIKTTTIGTADFGPRSPLNVFSGPLTLVDDGTGPSTSDACEAPPTASLLGKVAYVTRSRRCPFEAQAANVQAAGAVAAIIGNQIDFSYDFMGVTGMRDEAGFNATIPTINVGLVIALTIENQLRGAQALSSTLESTNSLVGVDSSGRPLLYAPSNVAPGSSLYHFDTSLTPNVLMEPAITGSLDATHMLDITLAQMEDLGWNLDNGNAHIGSCDTGVKLFKNPGLIAGANVQAQDRLCRAGARGNRSQYLRCMNDTAVELRNVGMISAIEQASVRVCAAKVTSL